MPISYDTPHWVAAPRPNGHHHGDPVKGIAMPRHGLTGRKSKSAYHGGSMMKEDFVGHCLVAEMYGRVALRLPK